jgi:tripartite-type tricarboxylate transporter receptor subunit TctC
MLQNLFARRLRPIIGYAGGMDVFYAIARGEIDGGCGSLESMPSTWLAGDAITPIVRLVRERPPEIPAGTPSIFEVASSERQRIMADLFTTPSEIGRPLVAPPALNPERLETLRRAFAQAVADPGLRSVAATRNLFIQPRSGASAEDLALRFVGRSAAFLDDARRIMD